MGKRNGKTFACSCGHVDHADSNAAFNISVWKVMTNESSVKPMKCGQSVADRDATEGSTDTPQIETSMLSVEKQKVLV